MLARKASDPYMYCLLALFPNIRLSWKNFLIGNTLAYFASPSVMKKKCFITLAPGVLVVKLFSVFDRGEKYARVFPSGKYNTCKNGNLPACLSNIRLSQNIFMQKHFSLFCLPVGDKKNVL